MEEDAKIHGENAPEPKDETKNDELKLEELEEVAGGHNNGGAGTGSR